MHVVYYITHMQFQTLSALWMWFPTNVPPKYCCLCTPKDWRALSRPCTNGPSWAANSLFVTLVVLAISSFCHNVIQHKFAMVTEGLRVSDRCVIAGVNWKDSVQWAANSWQRYELLFLVSLASTKNRPHTLQRSLTFVVWCSIQKPHLLFIKNRCTVWW